MTPCATCRWVLATPQQCSNAACATTTPNYFAGALVTAYLGIDDARAAGGPCGPAAGLWAAVPSVTSLPTILGR